MVLTVCGHCFSDDPDREIDYETDILQGNLVAMDGSVYLRRRCRRGHGEVMSLYEEDYGVWEDLQQWRIPTRQVVPDRAGHRRPTPKGCPAGLPSVHQVSRRRRVNRHPAGVRARVSVYRPAMT